MGLSLNALADKTDVVYVTFMGQTARIVYNPTYITQETLGLQHSDATFPTFFINLIKDWDVERNDEKVPITEEEISTLPLTFLQAIVQRVISRQPGSGKPEGEEEGKASNAG